MSFVNIDICFSKYKKVESGLKSEFKKLLLAIFLDNRFETEIDFAKLSSEKIPLYQFPEEFDSALFLENNGQQLYSFIESLLRTEVQKLLLHQMFGDQYQVNIDWDKCSAEIVPYYLIDIYAIYFNWNILIAHNDISSDILKKHEDLFLDALHLPIIDDGYMQEIF